MEECKDLIKLINESVSDISAIVREDPVAIKQSLSTLERLIASLDNNNLDYVICALEKRRTSPQKLQIVQGDLELRIGVSSGYAMEDVTNEYRSGRQSLEDVCARIAEATGRIQRAAVSEGEDVVLEANPRIFHEQSVTVPFAFVELVLDEYRSFAGVVVCITLRTSTQFFIVNASQEFFVHVESPVFHCWKCLVNFRGTYSAENAVLFYEGTHSIVPCTHSSAYEAGIDGSFCEVEGSVVNIRAGASRRTFGLQPFEFRRVLLDVPAPPLGQRELLDLRHFVARSNDRSLDYVMTDKQLVKASENRCLKGRLSPLVRAYIGDFLRIFPRSRSDEDDLNESGGYRRMRLDVNAPD